MSGSTFGKLFKISTYGESHGKGIGVVIEGCPAGLEVDMALIANDLERRKPGQSKITTQRKEDEAFEILSGTFEGKTTGTPISIFIKNKDQKSKDYDHLKDNFRPSHADYTYHHKYGIRDYRGGGRSSARETAARVAAGAFAKMLLNEFGLSIHAYVDQVGDVRLKANEEIDLSQVEDNIVRCPHLATAEKMITLIKEVKKEGDTIGGAIKCLIQNCPIGLGEPVFDKLHADLAKGMMSINAVKGFEYGAGFDAILMRGSAHNDVFETEDSGKVKTKTNFSGGIQGGISNGMDIYCRVAFKPVATLLRSQESLDKEGNPVTIEGKGRHDPCVVPRAVPIVEAMAALVLADHFLRNRVVSLEKLKA